MRGVASLVTLAVLLLPAAARADCRKKAGAYVGAECHEFGARSSSFFGLGWDTELPALTFALGLRTLSLDPKRGGKLDGNVESSPLAYHYDASQLGDAVPRFYGFETSVTYAPIPFAYFGALVAAGVGGSPSSPLAANGLTVTPRGSLGAFQILYGGVLGARLPLGPVSLRAELFAGGQSVTFSQYASDGARELTATASLSRAYVEPRAALDVWVSPFATVSAVAGFPSGNLAAMNGGIAFSGHFRAFDGSFSLF